MNLINYCHDHYKSNGLERTNGVPCSEKNVQEMALLIKSGVVEIAHHHRISIANGPLSRIDEGKFDPKNADDISALIFEVFVDRNRNPTLWNDRSPGGIISVLSHYISLFFFGPTTALTQDTRNGITGTDYAGAKASLVSFYDKSLNSFP